MTALILRSKLEDRLLSAVHYRLLEILALTEALYSSVMLTDLQLTKILMIFIRWKSGICSQELLLLMPWFLRYEPPLIKPCNLRQKQCDTQYIHCCNNIYLFTSTTFRANYTQTSSHFIQTEVLLSLHNKHGTGSYPGAGDSRPQNPTY